MEIYQLYKPKVFVLISDPEVYNTVSEELKKSGFETVGLLSEISQCSLIVVDGEALKLDIVNYLSRKNIEKKVLLILTESQRYYVPQQAQGFFQDILVIQDRQMFEDGDVISAMEGPAALRDIFESYLPGFVFLRHERALPGSRHARPSALR